MEKTTEGSFQCVVISLKEEFYSHADALIGIYSEVSLYSASTYRNVHQCVSAGFCVVYLM